MSPNVPTEAALDSLKTGWTAFRPQEAARPTLWTCRRSIALSP